MAVFLERLDGDASAISRGGDSGALWYSEETGEGIGLHHDGKVSEGIAVAVPLPFIVSAYERRHNGPFEPWDGTFIDDEEATP